jgi:hypothetical protein
VDNIKMDLARVTLDGIDWIDLAQDRCPGVGTVKTVMHFHVSCKIGGLSVRAQLRGVSYETDRKQTITTAATVKQ